MNQNNCPNCGQPLPAQRTAFCSSCRSELSESDSPINSKRNRISNDEESAIRFARERTSRGASRDSIINELVRRGLDRGQAVFIVHQQTNDTDGPHESNGQREIMIGMLFFGGGMAVTLLTYLNAFDAGGGRYFIATGPIILGVVFLIRGFSNARTK